MSQTSTSPQKTLDRAHEKIPPRVYLIALLAGLSGLLYGYDSGAISAALPPMIEDFGLSEGSVGAITSMLLFGSLPAIVVASVAALRFDRRHLLLVAGVIFVVGSIGCGLATSAGLVGAWRFFLGLGVGIANMFGLIYLSELAPTRIRGMLSGLYQLAVNCGILSAYVVGGTLAPSGAWEWILALGAVPAVVFFIGMYIAPPSPRWLLTRGRENKALKVLRTLRGTPQIAELEVREMKEMLNTTRGGVKDLVSHARKPVLLLLGLTFFQVFTGINAVIYYAPIIFGKLEGLGSNSGLIANYSVGIALVVSTAVALPMIDRVGRVTMLAWSMAGQTLSMVALWVLPESGWITVVLVFLYTFSFGFGMGPVFWLLVPELLPLRLRAVGMGVVTFAQYLMNAIFSSMVPPAIASYGSVVFLVFGVLSLAAFFYVLRLVPETSGQSLENIENYWKTGSFEIFSEPAQRNGSRKG
ncbi:sugar porter family MFS transporter [Rothia koreensis]|uniref:sugar porter family MFS transporter n=1 Tax=Rothia koreensis TaxID=592378 RepID=UPI003FCEA5B1